MRRRLIALAAVCVALAAASVVYVLHSRNVQRTAASRATPVASTTLSTVNAVPHIVFRNTALGTTYGRVAVVTIADPHGPRAVTERSCDRVFAVPADVVCLARKNGVVPTYSASVLNPDFRAVQSLPLAGIPSRARLSADGRFAATTTFVAGDSYAGTNFSTRTTISKVDGSTVGSLETFRLVHDGATIAPVDRNFWGVTFAADDDTFYATVAWSGHTWLARGSISRRTVTTLHEDAECPSLSPDGRHIVFKQRGSLPPGRWRLVEYTVATGQVTPLAETRSVDDQVAWLDDDHVVYGLARSGSQAAVDDVWEVPADGTGHPRMLIPQAWSPAVVR